MILTNAVAKRDFYLIRHFGVKMSPVPRHTPVSKCPRRPDSRVKLSCFAKIDNQLFWAIMLASTFLLCLNSFSRKWHKVEAKLNSNFLHREKGFLQTFRANYFNIAGSRAWFYYSAALQDDCTH